MFLKLLEKIKNFFTFILNLIEKLEESFSTFLINLVYEIYWALAFLTYMYSLNYFCFKSILIVKFHSFLFWKSLYLVLFFFNDLGFISSNTLDTFVFSIVIILVILIYSKIFFKVYMKIKLLICLVIDSNLFFDEEIWKNIKNYWIDFFSLKLLYNFLKKLWENAED